MLFNHSSSPFLLTTPLSVLSCVVLSCFALHCLFHFLPFLHCSIFHHTIIPTPPLRSIRLLSYFPFLLLSPPLPLLHSFLFSSHFHFSPPPSLPPPSPPSSSLPSSTATFNDLPFSTYATFYSLIKPPNILYDSVASYNNHTLFKAVCKMLRIQYNSDRFTSYYKSQFIFFCYEFMEKLGQKSNV